MDDKEVSDKEFNDKKLNDKKFRKRQTIITLTEIGANTAIALIAYSPLSLGGLGIVIWFVGMFFILNRLITNVQSQKEMADLTGCIETVGTNNQTHATGLTKAIKDVGSKNDDNYSMLLSLEVAGHNGTSIRESSERRLLRKLINTYDCIPEMELADFKKKIINESLTRLERIKTDKSSEEMDHLTAFMNYTSPFLERIEEGDEIMAVSFLYRERDKSYNRQRWVDYNKANIKAAEKATIDRIFIVDTTSKIIKDNLRMGFASMHIKENPEKPAKMKGHYMEKSSYDNCRLCDGLDSEIREAVGQGFFLIKRKNGEKMLVQDRFYDVLTNGTVVRYTHNPNQAPDIYRVVVNYNVDYIDKLSDYFSMHLKKDLPELSEAHLNLDPQGEHDDPMKRRRRRNRTSHNKKIFT